MQQTLPESGDRPACLWTVAADLDGDGKPDRLVLWTTSTARGAVAYLASGGSRSLESTPRSEQSSTLAWTALDAAGGTATPLAVRDLTGSGRQLVLVGTDFGVHGAAALLRTRRLPRHARRNRPKPPRSMHRDSPPT
jgi:hypothetical protein